MPNSSLVPLLPRNVQAQVERILLGRKSDNVTSSTHDETSKPSIFQRAWQHVTPKNVLKVATGLALAAGYVALWVFAPPVALTVSITMATTVGGAAAMKTLAVIFGNNPAPDQNQERTVNIFILSQQNTLDLAQYIT